MKHMDWEITPDKAWVIEASLKGNKRFDDLRGLLLRVGEVIVWGKPKIVSLSETELWRLRDLIDPKVKPKSLGGFELLIEIYRMLLLLNGRQIPAEKPFEIPEFPKNVALQVYDE